MVLDFAGSWTSAMAKLLLSRPKSSTVTSGLEPSIDLPRPVYSVLDPQLEKGSESRS